VPKNEFVNIMQRVNDLPIDDLEAVYADRAARGLLLSEGRLPTQPGGLAELGTVLAPNEIYDTRSRIVFYDDPLIGAYQRRFEAILGDRRYFRLRDNLTYFARLYAKIEGERKPVEWYLDRHPGMSAPERDDFRLFYQRYYDYIGSQVQEVGRSIALLDAKPD
jgi:hypothetical protein